MRPPSCLFLRWGPLRVERIAIGLVAAFGFVFLANFEFSHRCSAGNKAFEFAIPWILAVIAYAMVTRLRVWAALAGVIVLFAVLAGGSRWYIDAIHNGSPNECLKHSG